MTDGGYAEISPTVATEMILDCAAGRRPRRPPRTHYRGPEGHIAGSLNAPFDTIERQLPELLPYQNQTVLVYGDDVDRRRRRRETADRGGLPQRRAHRRRTAGLD